MLILDLGCGNARLSSPGNEVIGIDCASDTHADIVCNLGFERIPLDDSSVDVAYAHHFLEHIPESVYLTSNPYAKSVVDTRIERKSEDGLATITEFHGPGWIEFKPLIFLFNEIYRILKHEGVLIARVPAWPSIQSQQDPTHQTNFVEEKLNYFCGDYYGFRYYGHTSRFAKRVVNRDRYNWELHFELVAVKDRTDNEPYLLEYEGVNLWKTKLD